MKKINYLILILISIAVYIAPVNPIDADCNDKKVTVNTNIRDAIVTIQASNLDKTKLLEVGEIWDIGEGYTLTAQEIDVDGGKVWFDLSRNGSSVKSRVVPVGEYYRYNNIFSANLEVVFAGMNTNLAKLRKIYFFSEPYYWCKTSSGTTSINSENQWYWTSNPIDFVEENEWRVSYSSIDGYLKPENETQTASDWNCIEFTGFYKGGDIIITSNIAEASFTISGPGDYIKSGSGTYWDDYNVIGGSYTVDFFDVSGYSVTAAQTKILTPGNVAYFNATYTPLPIPSTPITTPTPTSSTTPIPTESTAGPGGDGITPTPTLSTTPMPTESTAGPDGDGITSTPEIPDDNEDTNVIVALIGAFATIIVAYIGYHAAKKK